MPSQLTCLWKEPKAAREYRAAVSLHGHTNHSKEGLSLIGEYADGNPILRTALNTQRREAQRKSAITVDFERAYWTPPLSPLEAFRLERDQIERLLGLEAMVSLTDHDNVEAPMLLRVLPESQTVPLSVEWSVPYNDTVLHIGIHNLPRAQAAWWMEQFAEYTDYPIEARLRDMFNALHQIPELLIILNHPMWDLAGVGRKRHLQLLHDFVGRVGMFLHAFELGGLRSWEENQRVLEFAEGCDQLLIGGGDRHGVEPSAVVNLTNARTFDEFVYEVRRKRRCHVLFMPQYSEPFTLRMLQCFLDGVREYPNHPEGSRKWDERVFHPDRHGALQPLITLWDAPPPFMQAFFWLVRLLERPEIRKFAQMALAKPKHQMQFVPGRGKEVVSQWSKLYGSRSFQTRMMKSMGWRTRAGNLKRSPSGADSHS